MRNWFRRVSSTAVRRQHADVSMVVPSAPRPRDPLQLRLQQQWCIPPTATVWRIQALARQTVARGIVDQRLLRRRTGAHQLRRDKADIKRHPAAVCLLQFTRGVRLLIIIITLGIGGDTQTDRSICIS